ncbi:MAG: hypothetical protein HQ490_04315 [Lutibacter sp.]|nr:hypothetical protein [Lutibacter sp.]
MNKVNLMIRTKDDKMFQSNGDCEINSVPRKDDYFIKSNTIYLVEYVAFDMENGIDLYLLETDISSLAITE